MSLTQDNNILANTNFKNHLFIYFSLWMHDLKPSGDKFLKMLIV